MTINPQIIFVCTANVCRSPYAESVAKEYINESKTTPLADIELGIQSGGVLADAHNELCPHVLQMVDNRFIHEVKEFNVNVVNEKSLIIVMEQHQQARLVSLFPKLRSQIFLVRAAEEIADKLAKGVVSGALFNSFEATDEGFQSPVMPSGLADRWDWLLSEFDAHRGLLPNLGRESGTNRFEIPDAHSSELEIHEEILDSVGQSVGNIMRSLDIILSAEKVDDMRTESAVKY